MKKLASIIVIALAGSASLAQDTPSSAASAPVVSAPTFLDAVMSPGQKLCPVTWSSTRSPTGLYLSLLRQSKTTKDKELLASGPASQSSDRSNCVIKIRFEKPAPAALKLSLDYRGVELKDPNATATLKIKFDKQEHTFLAGVGQWIDSNSSEVYRRFVIDIPKGANSMRIQISGAVKSMGKADTVMIGIDSIDMCFIDNSSPDRCGASGKPNQNAGS